MLTTKNANLNSSAKVMVDIWAKKCDNFKLLLFLNNNTVGLTELDHILQPPGLLEDKYFKLTDKVLHSLRYIYANYPDYDWYFKADDDTYVFTENLRSFLSTKNASKPVTFG